MALLPAVAMVATALAACSPAEEDDGPLVVETAHGKVEGFDHDGVRSWWGIPFAAPPVGDLRWAPPEEPDEWDGVRDAKEFGPACIQGGPTPGQTGVTTLPGSQEDCLYLNVNAPTDAEDLPVMVFIHGGGFLVGTGGYKVSNSPTVVQRGVVLVTMNYRLGRFGFFAHPALEGDVANFGLLDQVAALEWVQDNIEEFGGDPHNVTIFGQSAGGMSVNALMTSPAAEGLFDKAMVQSGLGRERSISLEDSREQGEQFLPGLDADELRDLDATRILGPPQDVLGGDMPIVDDVLPQRVADAFAAGAEADVPYLIGTTDAEFPDSFLAPLGRSPDEARAALLAVAGEGLVTTYGGEQELRLHLISDAVFTEPARLLAEAHAGRAPTYRYRFSIAPPESLAAYGGAVHSAEAEYVFDQSGVEDKLADQICDYWVSFARTGDPNHAGAPDWPEAGDNALLEFTNQGAVPVPTDPWDARLDAVEAVSEQLS